LSTGGFGGERDRCTEKAETSKSAASIFDPADTLGSEGSYKARLEFLVVPGGWHKAGDMLFKVALYKYRGNFFCRPSDPD